MKDKVLEFTTKARTLGALKPSMYYHRGRVALIASVKGMSYHGKAILSFKSGLVSQDGVINKNVHGQKNMQQRVRIGPAVSETWGNELEILNRG